METISEAFFNKGKYIWSRSVVNGLFNALKQIRESDEPESSERCFTIFNLELERAYRDFLQDLKDLPLVISCRAKGDGNSNFGGDTCLKLAHSFVNSAEKYIKESKYSHKSFEGSAYHIAKVLKEKASCDTAYAQKFESSTAKDYCSLGIDRTLDIFRESGYSV